MTSTAARLVVRVGCSFTYEAPFATPAILLVRPEEHGQRVTREDWQSVPHVPYHDYVDLFGNRCRRLTIPAGTFCVRYDADVETSPEPAETDLSAPEVPVDQLPDDALVFTLPSRFCLSDELSDFAWDTFGTVKPGWSRVQAICDFVNSHITFGYQNARSTRTAYEAYVERVGVCRDFAHLAVAFCRCMNIPTRYANGYLGDIGVPPDPAPMDFNAWFEVFLGGKWYTFDARHNMPRIGRILIARGRDAADIPLVNSFGPHLLKSFQVWTEETRSAEAA
jgi:transglutaminase-like putative cysteine protease